MPADLTAVFKTDGPVPKFLPTFSLLSYVTRPGALDSSYVSMSGFQSTLRLSGLVALLAEFSWRTFLDYSMICTTKLLD